MIKQPIEEVNIFCNNCRIADQHGSTYKLSTIQVNSKIWLLVTCSKCGKQVSDKLTMWTELAPPYVVQQYDAIYQYPKMQTTKEAKGVST